MVLGRANEESETKRDRVTKAWANKRANAKTWPLTAMAPAWLKLSSDRKRFHINPERAQIVRSIFEDSASGIGNYVIVKHLNEKCISPFGPARKTKQGIRGWYTCSVRKILSNRAVLGECQPHHWVNGKRVPAGDPILNYFPPIIDEELFYRAQQGREQRLDRYGGKGHGGRKGNNVSNLFSGIVRCAYCGSSIHFENKSRGAYLFCNAARRGLGCERAGWKYQEFERIFLAFAMDELQSILNGESSAKEQTKLEGEIVLLKANRESIEKLKEKYIRLLDETDDTLFVGKKLTEAKKQSDEISGTIKKKEEELIALKSTTSFSKQELGEAIEKLQKGTGMTQEELYKLRAATAAKFKTLIKSIYLAPDGLSRKVNLDFIPENKFRKDMEKNIARHNFGRFYLTTFNNRDAVRITEG
jgi:hypothetical protein